METKTSEEINKIILEIDTMIENKTKINSE
jgi:hypothetical protein